MAWNRRPSIGRRRLRQCAANCTEIEYEVFEFASHRYFCCNHRYARRERPGRADVHTIGDVEIDDFSKHHRSAWGRLAHRGPWLSLRQLGLFRLSLPNHGVW